MSGSARWLAGAVGLEGGTLPDGAVVLAVHHTRHDDAVAVRSAIRSAGRRRPWLGLVAPTRAVPWGTSARSRALAELRAGRLVVVFPEGGIAPGRAIYKGDVEVAHLALEAGAPVVPAVMSEDGRRLVLGESLDFSRHASTPHSRAVLRAVTDEVMDALSRLSHLPYHDLPATAARQEAAEARRERSRAARTRRAAARERDALERQEARAEAAAEAADLAQDAISAREQARRQARQAALADRLRVAGLDDLAEASQPPAEGQRSDSQDPGPVQEDRSGRDEDDG